MSERKPMIPIFSAVAANRGIDLAAAVTRVLDSHWYVLGTEVAQFESEFAGYIGVGHCISVANGTDALELGLKALGVGPGDAVVCVANAGFYGSTAARSVGAIPMYVDVDPVTLTMSPPALADALVGRPAAVIVTHLYGQLADLDPIVAMCRSAKVPLIEDCAQAHGASRDGKMAGSFADIGCFSFYPTKNLGAIGDGGAIVTRNGEVASRLRTLRQYGWSSKYEVALQGGRNSRLDEIQAAVLRQKLPELNRQNTERRNIALRYNEAFSQLPLRCPSSTAEDFAAHLYVVRTPRREALRSHLREHGVATDVHYPIPDTRQPAYAPSGALQTLPVTEAASGEVVSLPCFPGMTAAEVAHVIAGVRSFFAIHGAAKC